MEQALGRGRHGEGCGSVAEEQQEEEKYGGVMVENPSAELKRDVVKLNNVCNIYARRRLTRVRRRDERGSMYLSIDTRRDASIPWLGCGANYTVAIINGCE